MCMACVVAAHDQCGRIPLIGPVEHQDQEQWCECPCGTGEAIDPLTHEGRALMAELRATRLRGTRRRP